MFLWETVNEGCKPSYNCSSVSNQTVNVPGLRINNTKV